MHDLSIGENENALAGAEVGVAVLGMAPDLSDNVPDGVELRRMEVKPFPLRANHAEDQPRDKDARPPAPSIIQ